MNETKELRPISQMAKKRSITINANTGYDLDLYLTKYTLKTFINKNGSTVPYGDVEIVLSNSTNMDVAEISNDIMKEINGFKTIILATREDKSLLITGCN